MAAVLAQSEHALIELALRKLNADFCYYLDHLQTEQLANLFTEDALYTHGARESRGRDAIRTLFDSRNETGTRTSRHIQSGLRFEIHSEQSAQGNSVCITLVADRAPPIPHTTINLVADFTDVYTKNKDGEWRIQRRHIERIFVAPGNAGPVGAK